MHPSHLILPGGIYSLSLSLSDQKERGRGRGRGISMAAREKEKPPSPFFQTPREVSETNAQCTLPKRLASLECRNQSPNVHNPSSFSPCGQTLNRNLIIMLVCCCFVCLFRSCCLLCCAACLCRSFHIDARQERREMVGGREEGRKEEGKKGKIK